MSACIGTGLMFRLLLRRDWLRITIWVLAIAAILIPSFGSFSGLYDTQESIDVRNSLMDANPAGIVLTGPRYGLDTATPDNLGPMAAHEMFATTFMRSWVDFDWIVLVIQPLFLLSATFFPLGTYPGWAQPIVQATPLYHGVALERGLMLGEVGWGLLWHVAYLVVLGGLGIWATARRIETLLRA